MSIMIHAASIRKTVIRKKATGKIICRYVRWTAVLRGITPGTLPEITGKADNPQIMAVDAGDKYYIQMICGLDGAQIYYNIEGRKPVVAAEKNCLYREGFYLDKSRINMIQAIAVKDTYYDSDACLLYTSRCV